MVEFVEPSGYILEVFDNEENKKNIINVLESDIYLIRPNKLSDSEQEYPEKIVTKGG